ncbi:MAG: hypothetical protein KAH22_05515 [Thiotrichaceae bacterium]|nr:hypothetical protein [Thiotrichaceae bacterium]
MQFKTLTMVGLTISLTACTLNEGQPPETLCLKLTEHLMGIQHLKTQSKVTQKENSDQTLSVYINWQDKKQGDKPLNMTARCIYLSDADDAGEDFNLQIEKSYQTVPDKMFINNQAVRPEQLYPAIHNITGIAIKETIRTKILNEQ